MNIYNHTHQNQPTTSKMDSNHYFVPETPYQHHYRPQICSLKTQIQHHIHSAGNSGQMPFLQETMEIQLKQSKHKIELCRAYSENGYCQYGPQCIFAHGVEELYQNHPSIRVRFCKNFYQKGYCRYGKRCNFRHDKSSKIELPKRNVDFEEAKQYLEGDKKMMLGTKIEQDKLKNQSAKAKLSILKKKLQLENEKALKKLRLRHIFCEFPEILVSGYESSLKFRHLVEFEYRSEIDSQDCNTNKYSECTDIPSD